jgi:hypothetical protein
MVAEETESDTSDVESVSDDQGTLVVSDSDETQATGTDGE